MVDLEGAHLDPLDRLDHEVRQIILRGSSPEDRAEAETPGDSSTVDKFAHGEILTENLNAQSPTHC